MTPESLMEVAAGKRPWGNPSGNFKSAVPVRGGKRERSCKASL